jgi:hypothetical protein
VEILLGPSSRIRRKRHRLRSNGSIERAKSSARTPLLLNENVRPTALTFIKTEAQSKEPRPKKKIEALDEFVRTQFTGSQTFHAQSRCRRIQSEVAPSNCSGSFSREVSYFSCGVRGSREELLAAASRRCSKSEHCDFRAANESLHAVSSEFTSFSFCTISATSSLSFCGSISMIARLYAMPEPSATVRSDSRFWRAGGMGTYSSSCSSTWSPAVYRCFRPWGERP